MIIETSIPAVAVVASHSSHASVMYIRCRGSRLKALCEHVVSYAPPLSYLVPRYCDLCFHSEYCGRNWIFEHVAQVSFPFTGLYICTFFVVGYPLGAEVRPVTAFIAA